MHKEEQLFLNFSGFSRCVSVKWFYLYTNRLGLDTERTEEARRRAIILNFPGFSRCVSVKWFYLYANRLGLDTERTEEAQRKAII